MPEPAITEEVSNSPTLFDRWSRSYDDVGLQQSTYRGLHRAVLAELAERPPNDVLDLGCGTGQLLRRIGRDHPGTRLIGTDFSSGMLAEARGRVPTGAALAQADSMRLPLADNSVDVVTCIESFHWYRNQAAAAREIRRVLTPGGRLMIASISTFTSMGANAVRAISAQFGQPISALPPAAMLTLLSDAGFGITQQRRIRRRSPLPLPLLTVAQRLD